MLTASPENLAIWQNTADASYNAMRWSGYGAFLTADQKARLERIRQARLLFDGKHKQYYLDEQRTQFDFAPIKVAERTIQMYLTHNLLGLISLKGADLLFGEEPLLRADDPYQQDAISKLTERCNLHSLLYGCAVDASYEAECFLEACRKTGQVYLRQISADGIFPIGDLQPDGQFSSYAQYDVKNVGTDQAPLWLLLVTTFKAGSITREVWQLGDNNQKQKRLAINQWPTDDGVPLVDVELTGISTNTIVWVPNLLIRGNPVSDYDGAIELQDSLNAKYTQIGRVLAKHADPKLALPEEMFDGTGHVPAGLDAMAYREPERIAKYITWNAELANAMTDRAFVVNQLLVRTETSPVLLGLKEGAAPDAYKKVRLESFNSLTKAARKAAFWKAGIRRAIAVALDLEQTLPGVRYDRGPVAVELRDGIPIDDKELAERQAILRGARLISRRRALTEQLRDPAAVEKELAELEEEDKEQMPTAFMANEPTTSPADQPSGDSSQETEAKGDTAAQDNSDTYGSEAA